MKKLIFKLGRETRLPKIVIDEAPSSGPFDDYAKYLLKTYDVEVNAEDLAAHLDAYGAWSGDELKDHDQNKARLLWLACLDCKENDTEFYYMGV